MNNELTIFNNQQDGMTSVEIAKITNKLHKNVLSDIRDEISKLGDEISRIIFYPSNYVNSRNQKQPMYILTNDGVMQLAARYDAVVRFRIS